MSGMGIGDFLTKDPGGRNKRSAFFSWKEKKEAVIWLCTTAGIHFAWTHQFMVEDEIEEEVAGVKRQKQILRFPRFVSPDHPDVCKEQHFRDRSTDRMKNAPDKDPFLILREWLRIQIVAGTIAPETVVFEWWDAKHQKTIRWHAGHLARLTDRGKQFWDASVDAKLQYTFVLADNANLAAGLQISQESSSLGDSMRAAIKAKIDSDGEVQGDPYKTPYAFKWTFDVNAKNMNDMYQAYPYGRAPFTDEVYDIITNPEPPDVSRLVTPQPDDLVKIRAAFEKAMRIDLPLSLIFSDLAADRSAALHGAITGIRPDAVNRPASPTSAPAVPATTGAAARPATVGGIQRPGGVQVQAQPAQAASAPVAAAAPVAGAAPIQSRKKKVVEPVAPPPAPAVDLLACPDCGVPGPATDPKCAACGCEFDVNEDPAAVTPAPSAAWSGVQRPTGGTPQPAATQAVNTTPSVTGTPCFACGGDIAKVTGKCINCGMADPDLTQDEIPF